MARAPHSLTQEDIDMLHARREIDAKFEEFMVKTTTDVEGLQKGLAANTATTNAIHTALFAKDDNNVYGMPGLMTNMQKVVTHTEVVCNIAKFAKRLAIGLVAVLIATGLAFKDVRDAWSWLF
jgi:hypothetical protein